MLTDDLALWPDNQALYRYRCLFQREGSHVQADCLGNVMEQGPGYDQVLIRHDCIFSRHCGLFSLKPVTIDFATRATVREWARISTYRSDPLWPGIRVWRNDVDLTHSFLMPHPLAYLLALNSWTASMAILA